MIATLKSKLDALLVRKMAIAFLVAFGGVFLSSVTSLLDRVAHGSPSGFGKSFLISLVAAAVVAGLRAVLALSPINIVPSDAKHSLVGGKPGPSAAVIKLASPETTASSRLNVTVMHQPTGARGLIQVSPLTETVQRGKRLGRHVEHDQRSRRFAVSDTIAPRVAVLWQRYGKPFNQGRIGSCTGNAIAGVLNTDPFRTGRKGRLLTEKDAIALYELATKLDSVAGVYPPDDTGSSGLAVCKAAKQLGYIAGYKHAFSLAAALAALKTGPVITGVNWYEGFDTPNADGVVEISGAVRGGHEFEVLGYDPTTDLLTCENSWGASYGHGGRFYFTSATWARLLAEQGDVTVPLPIGSAS